MRDKAFVIILWFDRRSPTFEIQAVISSSLETAKEYVAQELENGRDLIWFDGRTFSSCEPLLPTYQYYTIHWIPVYS